MCTSRFGSIVASGPSQNDGLLVDAVAGEVAEAHHLPPPMRREHSVVERRCSGRYLSTEWRGDRAPADRNVGALRARPYVDADLPAVKAALASWIRDAGWCGYCHPGDVEHRIYREAPARRDAYVWEDSLGIAGIEITGRFGHVFDVFARPDCRGEPELEMLRAAAIARHRDRRAAPATSSASSCSGGSASSDTATGITSAPAHSTISLTCDFLQASRSPRYTPSLAPRSGSTR